MRYKAKIKADVELIVWINEDRQGNQEIDDVEDVGEINDYEVIHRIG